MRHCTVIVASTRREAQEALLSNLPFNLNAGAAEEASASIDSGSNSSSNNSSSNNKSDVNNDSSSESYLDGADASDGSKLVVAWQYEKYIKKAGMASSSNAALKHTDLDGVFCCSYDLSRPMQSGLFARAQIHLVILEELDSR
jgi:hypothetical protein